MSDLPVPYGWFQVGWPDELPPGAVRPLFAFGRHLVLWRDDHGAAHLHDAFCPHLGAHLGHGGRVEGDTVVCPLHGRSYDEVGHLCALPVGELTDGSPAIRTYPVVERNGLVMAWFDPDDRPPAWEIPVVAEFAAADHTEPERREFAVAAPLQEMAENGADSAHFGYVHGQATVPSIDSYETDGPTARMRSTQRWPTGDGEVDAFVEATSHGPGFSVIRMTGVIDTVSIGCNTPITADRCHLRFSFTVKRLGDDAMTALVGDAFIGLLTEQIREDIRIWEHKRYVPRPALAPTDGPVMQFRSWIEQFYPGGSEPG